MINFVDKVHIYSKMVQSMRVNLIMTFKRAKVLKLYQMEADSKGIL